MTHFLQSEAWESFQKALGRTPIYASGKGWSYRAYLESGTLNTRLYTPYGPDFSSDSALKEAVESLIKEGKKKSATFVRIEPTKTISHEIINEFHMKQVTYQHLQPQHTQIIDLSESEETILSNMSQGARRYIVRNQKRGDITIKTSQDPKDISILLDLLDKVAARTGFRPQSKTYLTTQAETLLPSNNATLYFATIENKPIAAVLFFDSETTRAYAHVAADDDYRKLQPSTVLVGQAILDAKAQGKKFFDFYGIAPPDAPSSHPWAGFTRFKQSFGGSSVTYAGAWDIPLKPLQYRLYRLYQSIYGRLR